MSEWFLTYGFAEVHDGLLIGAYPLDEADVDLLAQMAVRHVLNLVEDEEYPPGRRRAVAAALDVAGIEEERMRLTDFGRLPAERLQAAVQQVVAWMRRGELSYVHCRAGWQRSAAVAVGAVAVCDELTIDAALDYVQQRKPSADPLPHQRDDLDAWWARRGAQSALD
ncbi:MAG: protein-tyrosine phosphatase family protein [Solirubrobacteraceae bacterium]